MQEFPWYISPKTDYKVKSAIVIGGGLAGTSAAYSMAVRGWDVTLIERNAKLCEEASGNPVGILTPLITHKNDPIGDLYMRGFEYSLSHLKKLVNSGYEIDFYNTGALELSTAKITKELYDIIIPETDIKKISPQQASQLCGLSINSNALFMEKCGVVSPAKLSCANILAGGSRIGLLFSENILSLVKEQENWIVKDVAGLAIASASVVIIANAADAIKFIQCKWIPIYSVRGQLTYLPARAGFELNKILCYDGGYITPEFNGFHYVGATYTRDNSSREITIADNKTNIENLGKIINIGDIDYALTQARVGFRATLTDRRPVIGAVPDIGAFYEDYADLRHGRKYKSYPAGKYLAGLYISVGHGSRGITSCPIGGELIAAMINNEAPTLPQNITNTLNPARFIIKNLSTYKAIPAPDPEALSPSNA